MTSGPDVAGLLRLVRQIPLPPELRDLTGADDSRVAAIAARYDRQLPEEYVRWLRVCDGSYAGPGGIFGVRDALDVLGFHPDWAGRGWLPVAGDGCGNYYVLDLSREHIDRDAVYFVDTMAGEGLTYLVASSFLRFLRFLLEGELGERRWPFRAGHVSAEDPEVLLLRDEELFPWSG
ncbi:cell wall assembly regulator SMI1 [Actinoplanes octamycinicus]|uniref:Cell wall assembly regulator SMI1 n=1 Tax=Actinoplanes octamycinicus TaxID=135948 RepID=A0A7W7MBE8_9ACTN|nr:SMI1/KNR4 family protein [Actinoplanes octamycinicus]MBB4743760.1 cell wall assembly regulator SMI1 [Actinoplanes octamycinicus]GIE58386.1 hypothetical protein Aoc01nite_37880 [Actinoplanes octamycinicus]